jgi:membrane dipeptidase
MTSLADPGVAERARALQRRSVVVDALFVPVLTPTLIARLRAGGVTTVHATVAIHENFRGLAERLFPWHRVLDAHRDDVALVTSVADIRRVRAEDRIGVIFGVQNTTAVEDDVRLLRAVRDLGVRIVQLTYNERNLVGDGCAERVDAGLSDFGIELVREMNRLRLLVDVSHAAERTILDAAEVSAAPVVATHSNARARCDHPRNLSDAAIRAIAATGGVVGINAFPGFVSAKPGQDQTIADYLDHVEYVGDLVGRDRVAIGLDLDEEDTPKEQYLTPDGEPGVGRHRFKPGFLPPWPWIYPIRSVAHFPRIVEGLLGRGYSDDEVQGVIGENVLRVLTRVWGA